MGKISITPYWTKRGGVWIKITPEPVEYNDLYGHFPKGGKPMKGIFNQSIKKQNKHGHQRHH